MSLPPDGVIADAMSRALCVSERACGYSTPNPPVGAVVLDASGRIVGTGATEAPGGRHAEIVALDEAGLAARGGTLIVTLEPCSHTGRTGPCVERIVGAELAAVVYAVPDLSEQASGGAQVLRSAGLLVQQSGASAAQVGPLRAWLHRMRTGRPLVTWKYAASLDGRVAAADGTSQWITGPESRAHAHSRRSRVDAILVGTGTVAADDPSLTARRPDKSLLDRQPRACVMGLSGIPLTAACRRSPGGFQHLRTRDPQQALTELGDVQHIIVEGGPTVAGSFLAAGLVDEVEAYLAPIVLGEGRPAVLSAGVNTLSAAHGFSVHHTEQLGADLHIALRRLPEDRIIPTGN